MGLKMLYRAKGQYDAYLLRSLLQASQIRSEIKGENLAWLLGAIPVKDTRMSLWVHERDLPEAQKVLQKFSGPTLVHPAWVCAECGESNEANFDLCWNCESPWRAPQEGDSSEAED